MFFDQLAMSGDVARAAQAAGKTARSAHALRRRSARFAASWKAALDDGYERLEAALVRQVLGEAQTKLDVAAAILLLDRHRATGEVPATAKRKGADPGSARARAERELMRRLQALSRRTGAKDAR
jgi:hypothetical protein